MQAPPLCHFFNSLTQRMRVGLRAAVAFAASPDYERLLAAKREARAKDGAARPLENDRQAKLQRMRRNFWGFGPSYHAGRHNFIRKIAKSRMPLHLAVHRSAGAPPGRLKS
jgi:putative two-component system hydrogenase maturation factor HypX/HoxX